MGSSAKRRPRGWRRSVREAAKPLGGPTVIVNPTGAPEVARTEQEAGSPEERLRDALLLDGALLACQDMKNVLMHEGVLAEPVRRELRSAADNLLIARTRPVVESYLSERLGCVVTLDSLAELLDGVSDVVEGSGELSNLGVNGAVLQARGDALPGGGIADSVLDGGAAGDHDASPSLGGGAHSVGAGDAAGASVREVPADSPVCEECVYCGQVAAEGVLLSQAHLVEDLLLTQRRLRDARGVAATAGLLDDVYDIACELQKTVATGEGARDGH